MNKKRQQKTFFVLMHISSWVLLFSLPYLLRPSYDPNEPAHRETMSAAASFYVARLNDLLLIGFFYLNAQVLMARFLYRKKYTIYIFSLMLCLAGFSVISWLLVNQLSFPGTRFSFRRHLPFCIFVFLFILACSIAYRTIRDKMKADKLAADREHENLKTELSLLRSQVNPHFMFNVLNNMVALARKQSDLLEPSLIKLSSLMRYMLYDTGEQKVSLEKETEYLQSYIDLQQQRFGKKLILNSTLGTADKQYRIEPMLLIPFVENAFKHGTGMVDHAQIDVDLHAENDTLYFTVQNKYNPECREIKDAGGGIGLANVQRRLELLYHHHHSLDISHDNNIFSISLQIQLHQ